jgi:hypothetical protein
MKLQRWEATLSSNSVITFTTPISAPDCWLCGKRQALKIAAFSHFYQVMILSGKDNLLPRAQCSKPSAFWGEQPPFASFGRGGLYSHRPAQTLAFFSVWFARPALSQPAGFRYLPHTAGSICAVRSRSLDNRRRTAQQASDLRPLEEILATNGKFCNERGRH